jgi:hypothetical protein
LPNVRLDTRRPIKVYALEVVEILFLEIKDLPTDYPGMDAIAVEDVSVHDWLLPDQ